MGHSDSLKLPGLVQGHTAYNMAEQLTNAIPAQQAPTDAGMAYPRLSPADEHDLVLAFTERLFPGPIDVRREHDPEIQNHEYLVLNVVAAGTLDDIVSRDAHWHRELAKIAIHSPNVYCLNIDVQARE